MMDVSNFFDFNIDYKSCEQVETDVSNSEVKKCASIFSQNIKSVNSLLLMPKVIFVTGGMGTENIYTHTIAQIMSMLQSRWEQRGTDDEFLEKWKEEMRKIISEKGDQRFESMARDYISVTLAEIDSARDSFRVLMFSAISSSWTSFECLAKDLWISALDACPIPLGQSTIAELNSDVSKEGVSRKHIEVGLAARYGFDLRNCLGTILSEKYDFSGVKGIIKAYKDAFGSEQGLVAPLTEPKLKHLEATRHLIVHNAGRVDEKYRSITGSTIPVSDFLDFNVDSMSELINTSIRVGCHLIEYVDEWFRINTSQQSESTTA